MRSKSVLTAAIFGAFTLTPDIEAAEQFQRLTGAQIQTRFAGMEMSDEVHSADIFGRDGTLTIYGMGRKTTGKWRVQNNQLCVDRSKEGRSCYEVWMSGAKVELRPPGSNLPLEGYSRGRQADAKPRPGSSATF